MRALVFRMCARLMLVWFPAYICAPAFAQSDDFSSESFIGDEESSSSTETPATWDEAVDTESPAATPPPANTGNAESFLFGDEQPAATVPAAGGQSLIQNAVIEGVQLSSEDGAEPHEKIITVYFIFRDKPSSYFYEAKHKEKKIVFEFNDTEKGTSPVPSAQEPPIEGFRIEQDKVDINAQVKGLKPEWHDLIRVSFFMEGIPEINVKDEYSVISFSFKWSTDPDKVKQYMVGGNKKRKVILASVTGGVVALGAAAAIYYFFQDTGKGGEEDEPLDTADLPEHDPPLYE